MKRQQLINEVKQVYSNLSEYEKRDWFVNMSDEVSPDKYYEFVLDRTVQMIQYGAFDRFATGKEVVEAITNNKDLVATKWLTDFYAQGNNLQG